MADKPVGNTRRGEGTHLWLLIMKAFHSVAAHAKADLAKNGLGFSDFAVLELLLHKGPMPVNSIGPKVNLTPGSISTAVDRLRAKRLVSRTGTARDRRVRIVALTAKGRALIGPVFAKHSTAMDAISGGLSSQESKHLATLLKKLGKYAEALPC